MSQQYNPPPPGYPPVQQQGYGGQQQQPQQQPQQQQAPWQDNRTVVGGWFAAQYGQETGKYIEYKVLTQPTSKGGIFKTVKFFKPYKKKNGTIGEGDAFAFNQMKDLVEKINHFIQNYGDEKGFFVWQPGMLGQQQQPAPLPPPPTQGYPQQQPYAQPPQQWQPPQPQGLAPVGYPPQQTYQPPQPYQPPAPPQPQQPQQPQQQGMGFPLPPPPGGNGNW